jgi:hypothetical protein
MITFHCTCGQKLQVPDELGGARVRCPICRAVAVAPPYGSLPTGFLPAPEGAPTVSSHHDLTIKPAEPGRQRKESNT